MYPLVMTSTWAVNRRYQRREQALASPDLQNVPTVLTATRRDYRARLDVLNG